MYKLGILTYWIRETFKNHSKFFYLPAPTIKNFHYIYMHFQTAIKRITNRTQALKI